MICFCWDEELLLDLVFFVMELENFGNLEELDMGKVYFGIVFIIENMQEQRVVVENWKEGYCLGVIVVGDVNIFFIFDGRWWKVEKQVEMMVEQKVFVYYFYNV